MNTKYSITAVVPVFNEIQILNDSLQKIHEFLNNHFNDFEIIIVESGSTDGSNKTCDEISSMLSNIIVIHEGKQNGFGSALQLGFKNAKKELVWQIPLDLPFQLNTILQAIPYFSTYNCVLSYRSKDNRNFMRKLQSYIYNNLIKFTLRIKVKHINSAFKVFKRDVIQNMPLISNGWFIDAEIIYRLQEKNMPYTEIPVELIDRSEGKSTIKMSTPITIIKELKYFLRNKDNI